MENTITLKHVNVVFSELTDAGFGRSITIDATAPKIQEQIKKWVKDQKINGGEAKFKEYENKDGKVTIQYTFKLSDYTRFDGKDGLSEKDLGYNAVINLVARAYTYDNKFGKGISASLAAVYVVEAAPNNTMANIAE